MDGAGVLSWVLGLPAATILLYALAGEYVRRRARRDPDRVEQALARANHRTSFTLRAVTILGFVLVVHSRERLGPLLTSVLLYSLPYYWLVASVLGSSHLELRARALDPGLFRFSRFNLFVAFLLGGQALPFVSAAFAAPVDLERGASLLPWFLLHVAVAVLLGLGLRWLVVRRLVRPRPFPDAAVTERLAEVSREAGVRLGDVLLVPHEPGQSVNALAATTSRKIYVAEGLRRGLSREELTAVLLHELGHFAQPATNLLRNLGVPGLALAIWFSRARLHLSPEDALVLVLSTAGFVVSGLFLFRLLCRRSELRADRFADHWGPPGALARALQKIYARNLMKKRAYDSGSSTHPGLRHRLAGLRDG